ncbi:hypothetical protein AAFF_G00273390 [Aldrovandia affinis]|uniref:Uncharacterized protein n=1 Tax=Aldrovandia affinis TaxID=143900 RepID=A0AAD7SSQ2_9TELE|nr:hypothetical protein AAFF_G00273390 [Aldrovandia affinis]
MIGPAESLIHIKPSPLLLLGQKVTGLNMKTAIFLMCLIGMSLALPAQVEQKRVARSDSGSGSKENSSPQLPNLEELLKLLLLLRAPTAPAPRQTLTWMGTPVCS